MTYWGFDGAPHTGELVIDKSVADQVVSVFKKLSDDAHTPADAVGGGLQGQRRRLDEGGQHSGFNCRRVGTSGSWSQHAYGLAIDINTRSPYIHPYPGGTLEPPNAKDYVRRPLDPPGVINPGDAVVRAFKKIGWGCGRILVDREGLALSPRTDDETCANAHSTTHWAVSQGVVSERADGDRVSVERAPRQGHRDRRKLPRVLGQGELHPLKSGISRVFSPFGKAKTSRFSSTFT